MPRGLELRRSRREKGLREGLSERTGTRGSLPLPFLSAIAAALALASGCRPPQQVGENQPPSVKLLEPQAGVAVRAGSELRVRAEASDPEDGALDGASVLWASALSGQLATGSQAQVVLSQPGSDTLTVTVADSGGKLASASISLTVIAAGAPEVSILSPELGTEVDLGEMIDFSCRAFSADGSQLADSAIRWESQLSGPLGSGAELRAALAVAGADEVRCVARDPSSGQSAVARRAITVRSSRAPTVQILEPLTEDVYVKRGAAPPFSTTVRFRATAQDANVPGGPGNLNSSIHWILDPGGQDLGTGPSLEHTFGATGDYTVTARAVDPRGSVASDQVRIHQVANLPPQCAIIEPKSDGALVQKGAPTVLRGACFDPDGNVALSPRWSSSGEAAPLGIGSSVSATFSTSGAQTLSACATDPVDANLVGCARRAIRVFVDTPPSGCTILAPLPSAIVAKGARLALRGSAVDAEDPAATLRYRWLGSVDGDLGEGASTTTDRLVSAGEQTVTLTVTDPWGESCSASVVVRIGAPPSVAILSATQGSSDCLGSPCSEGLDLLATGLATDPLGLISRTWSDSLGGVFGSSEASVLPAPLAGRHTLVFSAMNVSGQSARAAAQVDILGPSGDLPIEHVASVPVLSLASNSSDEIAFVDGAQPLLYRYLEPAGMQAPLALSQVGLSTAEVGGAVLVGTQGGGVERCEATGCTAFSGGPLGDADVVAVAASEDPDLAALGTSSGLLLTSAADPSLGGNGLEGRTALIGLKVRAVAIAPALAGLVRVWAGTDSGVAELVLQFSGAFDLRTASITELVHLAPEIRDNRATALAISPEAKLYVGTERGFSALGEAGPNLREAPWNFPEERTSAIALETRALYGTSRSIVWAGTPAGLIRYDVGLDVATHFTKAELFAGGTLRAVGVMQGAKYLGTTRGLYRYSGP